MGRFSFWITLALLSIVLSLTPQEQAALDELYGQGWLLLNSCSAPGVTCYLGSVTQLNRTNQGLVGTIPASVGDLTSLTLLDFSSNSITGTVPASLCNLNKIQDLYLGGNPFDPQPLQSCWSNWTQLDYLLFRNMNLMGTIPPEIFNWPSVTQILLSVNNISGSLPSSIATLKNLINLSLRENSLTGSIPPAIFSNLTKLQQIALYKNNLNGTLPSSWSTTLLVTLDLSYNQLTGTLPSFSNMALLRTLNLSNNNFYGSMNNAASRINSGIYFDNLQLANNGFVSLSSSASNSLDSCSMINNPLRCPAWPTYYNTYCGLAAGSCIVCPSCNAGFALNNEPGCCNDINECANSTAYCGVAFCHNTNGSYYCTCNPGYVYNNALGCDPCADGTYETNGSCQPCPTNFTSTLASTYCTCLPGYMNVSGSCIGCPAGTYLDGGNNCVACPQNSNSEEGSVQCSCNPGYINYDSINGCTGCAANTYWVNSATCASCPTNSTSPATSLVCSCIPGNVNYTTANGCVVCPADTFESVGTCMGCSINSTSAPGSIACSCRTGYINSTGQCEACLVGTYQSGPTTCTACPGGSNSTMANTTCHCIAGYKNFSMVDGCSLAPCPPLAEGSPLCACLPGFTGSIVWNVNTENWDGVCTAISNTTVKISLSNSRSITSNLISTSDKLRLTTTINTTISPLPTFGYIWTEMSGEINLNDQSLLDTPVGTSSLVLKQGIVREGVVYTIRVNVTEGAPPSTITTAFISVTINRNPVPGNCTVSPVSGDTVTPITITCVGWSDPDGDSLSYSYSSINTSSSSTLETALGSSSTVFLSEGSIQVIVYGNDGKGGATRGVASPIVMIVPVQIDGPAECGIYNLSQTLLTQERQLNATFQVLQLVRLLISMMEQLSDPSLDPNSYVTCPDSNSGSGLTLAQFRSRLWDDFIDTVTEIASQDPLPYDVATGVVDTLLELVKGLNTSANSTQFQLVINVTTAVLDATTDSPELSQYVVLVLSELLETVSCDLVITVSNLLLIVSTRAIGGNLPDEAAVSLLSPNVHSTSARVYDSGTFNATIGNLSLSIPPEILSQSGSSGSEGVIDLTISRYGSALRRCRLGAIGDIISIDVTIPGGVVVRVTDSGTEFTFQLPIDTNALSILDQCNQKLSCAWWNTTENTWQTSGCRSLGIQTLSDGSIVQNCACVHMTDFATISEYKEGCSQNNPSAMMSFAVIYFVVAAFAIVQACRLHATMLASKHPCQINTLLLQHWLIMLTCLFRGFVCLRFGGWLDFQLFFIALFTAPPYCFVFILYTLTAFQWAAVYHYALKSLRVDPFTQVKRIFIISNVVVVAIIIALFAVIVSPGVDPTPVAFAGGLVLSIFSLLLGVGLVLYGVLVYRMLATGDGMKSHRTGSRTASNPAIASTSKHGGSFRRLPRLELSTRLLLLALVVGLCFVLESVMWLMSVVAEDSGEGYLKNTNLYTILFYCFDLIMLFAMLVAFNNAVGATTRKKSASSRVPDEDLSRRQGRDPTTASPRQTSGGEPASPPENSRHGPREPLPDQDFFEQDHEHERDQEREPEHEHEHEHDASPRKSRLDGGSETEMSSVRIPPRDDLGSPSFVGGEA